MTIAYVGNPLDAAGFRLAGVLCWLPDAGGARAAFEVACEMSDVIFIEPDVASALPRRRLDAALAASRPLTVIIPRSDGNGLDPAERVRTLLGMER